MTGTRAAARTVTLAIAVLLAALAAACGSNGDEQSHPRASGAAIETEQGTATPYGAGAEQVWLLEPRSGEVDSVVVYLHGFGAPLPFEWHLKWMDHLLENGSAVLFPRYQEGSSPDPFLATPPALEEGLRTGFAALGYDGEPVLAAGFSLGATLTLVYAGRAAEWGVPEPLAVYAVFPVDPTLVDPSLDLSTLDRTRVLLLIGDQDVVAGRRGADALKGGLTGLPAPLKELRLIRTSDALLADHEAPTLVHLPVVRETFWSPLDAMVEEARDG